MLRSDNSDSHKLSSSPSSLSLFYFISIFFFSRFFICLFQFFNTFSETSANSVSGDDLFSQPFLATNYFLCMQISIKKYYYWANEWIQQF